MRRFTIPRVVVSRCLEFDHCRYNGDMITSHIVAQMKGQVDFIPVCPEMQMGLGVPRDPVRIVRTEGLDRLIQPATGKNVTDEMNSFTATFLDSLVHVDGFVLKNRSPSCGIKDVNIYPQAGRSAAIDKAPGFFAREVDRRFSHLPVEDEGRLRNVRIRDHFLTHLFTRADFRRVKESDSIARLAEFHSQNKYLLMVYNQRLMHEMGAIVAHADEDALSEVIDRYEAHLTTAFTRAPRYTANINVLLHALGHFSDRLSHAEKAFFLDALERYREAKTSICPAKNIIKAWIVRFDDPYLNRQTYFAPFPDDLMEVELSTADRGREMW